MLPRLEAPSVSFPRFVLDFTVLSRVSLAKTVGEELGEGEERQFQGTLSGQSEMCRD